MGLVKVELNSAGVQYLLRSAAVEKDLAKRGRSISKAAGPGHIVASWLGPNRAHTRVLTATWAAKRSQAKYHTLTAALDAGRGDSRLGRRAE